MTWTVLLILFMCACTLASGFFSASETSLFSLSSWTTRSFHKSGNPRKQIAARLLQRPTDLLVTILILNVLVNILVQNTVSSLFDNFSSWLLKVGVPLLLTLFFGEVIPKTLALQHNQTIALAVAPTIFRARQGLGPIREAIHTAATFLSRTLFFFLKKAPDLSRNELQHALEESEQEGILGGGEMRLINGYFSLQDLSIKEIMHPRQDVLFYDINDPLSTLVDLFTKQEVSRVPVCKDNINNVLGLISAHTFFINQHRLNSSDDLVAILDTPYYIPETTPARALFRRLSAKGAVFAIVVDEYGSITGIVTLEDLVEIVIGDIQDKRDTKKRYSQASKNVIIASGKLELTEFCELFPCELNNPHNMVTIGGWLIGRCGTIPPSGTKHSFDGFLFHVLASDNKRIQRLYIRYLGGDK